MKLKHQVLLGAMMAALGVQAQAEVVDRIVVKLKPSLMMRSASADDISQTIAAASNGQAKHVSTMADGQSQVLQLPKGLSGAALQAYLKKLEASGEFESVEADVWMYPMGVTQPTDSLWSSLWGLQSVVPASNYGADFIGAWEYVNGQGVVVGVIDTGNVPHPDLGQLSPVSGNYASSGYSFISDCYRAGSCDWTTGSRTIKPVATALDQGDWCTSTDVSNQICQRTGSSSFHGSHVAGTIAALGYNAAGVIGGAYNARILPVRVLGKGGGSSIDITDGIRWAAGIHPTIPNPNPAKVINMSLGGSSSSCPSFYQSAINDAVAAGVTIVVAAGNENRDAQQSTPANCANVITVGATGKAGERASYSNFGSKITLAAPGGNGSTRITSTVNKSLDRVDLSANGAGYVGMNGTSMATPHVAAAVALMLSANPKLTFNDVVSLLKQSATAFPSGSTCTTSNCGAGILNAAGAVRLAKQSAGDNTEPVVTPVPTTPPVVTPKPTLPPVVTPKPTVPPVVTPTPVPPVAGCYVAWSEGKTFTVGDLVTFDGRNYKARTTHVAYVGTNWNPKASLTLWQDVGACTGTVTPSPAPVITPKPTVAPTAAPTTMPSATPAPVITPTPNCPAWSATATYIAGQCVAFNGKTFAAKWWTKGEQPGAAQWGPWAEQAAVAAKRK
ncbi:S8 family serine peptidase [Deefgea tanakiae]|uniref:S8 family serine peptidase n=1 Tax=Deefgea tanakiae TaxID=2865840 RepID=A0ABX8Z5C8_9NEIS|nr:S8 family serine peptidase [Deefgea tanakiae]QZA77787.1 S8 family serine peptidase [Deefgea tanakiae]